MLPLAWRAMRRAEMYGVPNNKRRRFDQLVDKLELALLEGHAFIELLGVPENADVRINGEQWLEPHNKWVPRNFSSIVIIHPEYVRHVFNWHHVRGKQHTRELEMIAASEYGRITITGSPSGAAVLLDGAHIGRLPSITTKLLKPGRYPVKVEHAPEFQASSQFVTVEAGGTTRVSIELEPAVSAFVKLLETKKFWGWTSAVTGGVLTITGAALLGVASGKAADARDLNARHDSGFPEYEERFDAAVDGVQGLQTGGHVMLWVGLAMAGAGATLLVVDSLQVQGEVQAPVSWQIVPAPTGASAIVRF